jgi:hypothetical protein
VRGDRRSRVYFLGAAIIFEESPIFMWAVSDIIIMLDVSGVPVEAAGFSPFEHPAMATTAMTNAKRFMSAPSV